MKLLKILPLLLALSACGGNYKETEAGGTAAQFGAQKVNVLSGSLTVSNGSISGSGAALFESRYGQFQSGGSYALDFRLNDGGSLTLVSHANEQLGSGYELIFRRQGAGNDSLKVELRAQGGSWASVSNFAHIDAAGNIQLQIDVHNDESPAHVLVWDRSQGDDFSANAAILNSGEEIDGSPGIGNGIRWGLVLDRAEVTRAERSEPKFEH